MIKVCHIVNLITGKADGVYSHLKMIFQNSDRTKFQHYLVFQGGEKIEREISELGVNVFVSESLKKKISVKAFFEIYRIIKQNNISIIHTHLVKPYTIAGLLNIFLRKKFIFNYHGLFLSENIYYGFTEKLIYRICHLLINILGTVNAVLVPSKRSQALLSEETKLFPEPIVYYNGFNNRPNFLLDKSIIDIIEKISDENKSIAIVARLEVQKRIDKALELFKCIMEKKGKVQLLIFGDGDLKQPLIEKTNNLGIESNVFFFDYVANIASYYCYFDVLLFTSDWEGTPLSIWEAMANKVPVLAPDVGGFKEILTENDCGLIYDPGNLNDAEEKLLKLLNDKDLRIRMGENGSAAIKTKYNERNFIKSIEDVYLSL